LDASSKSRQQFRLPGYASVICCSADGPHSTEFSLSIRWCTSALECGVQEFLGEIFPGKWIWWDGPVSWPPHSYDITPMEFSFGVT
jgi:hypothetical protein